MRIEKTVGVARPPAEVWAFIADARNDPHWCDKVDSVEQLGGDGPGREARYRVLHRPIPMRKARGLMVTVEEYEPPKMMRVRELEGPFPGPQIGRLLVARDIQRQLAMLKGLLEGRVTSPRAEGTPQG